MPTSPRFQPLGDFLNLTDDGDRVRLTTRRGVLEVASAPGGTLRVRLGPGKTLPPYQSLAVTPRLDLEAPRLDRLAVRQTQDALEVRAPEVHARLALEPVGLRFQLPGGGPAFGADVALGFGGGQVIVRKALQPAERLYGLGEKTGWLDKRHRRYTMRNVDVYLENPAGIGSTTDPLYASFPVFIVHSAQGSYGLFVDNPEFATFDFTQDAWYEVAVPAEALTYYLLPGPTLPDILRQYTDLTGRMPLPALWTLGFHQCRWSYATDAEVRRVAETLRSRQIPADAIWCDIDYMDGFRVFTWDKKDFPHPQQLTADLAQDGFRVVTIVDPGVKVDERYRVYAEGRAGGHFITQPNGEEYNGNVWPGLSAFPDFHRAETRDWWAGLVQKWLTTTGLGGLWNDMNEPAATDVNGKLMEARHAGGQLPHAVARNTYALQMARAAYAGMLAHNPEGRPFLLTRAAFSGAQTVTALWGGDNSAQWEHLAASLPLLMNLGLSGMPFAGVDIGGFAGDADGELLARWTQAGAFYPFCRNHAAIGTRPHEPWALGPEVEAICRRYLQLRYQLLPYFYNLFYQAAQTGAPVLRPLVWHYPHDAATFNLNDQFLLGPDLLVAPVLAPGLHARAVYLPEGQWYRWDRGVTLPLHGPGHIVAEAPLEELPLFVRGGAILPMWNAAAHTGAVNRASLRLHLWPGKGHLDFYEDDGETQAYAREAAGYRLTPFSLHVEKDELAVHWDPAYGEYRDARKRWTFVVHAWPGTQARLDGQPVAVRRQAETLTLTVKDDGQKHQLILSKK